MTPEGGNERVSTSSRTVAAEKEPPEFAAWRVELESLGPSVLRMRAMECGISSNQLDAIESGNDVTGAIIRLIFDQELADRAIDETNARKMHDDLIALRPSSIRERALAIGCTESAIVDAQARGGVAAVAQLIVDASF